MLTRTIPALTLAAVLLAGCAPATPDASPESPTPSPSTSSPAPEPTYTPVPDSGGIPADMKANIVDAMNSGNTAAIDGYLAPSVFIIYAASENAGDVTDHTLIVNDLSNATADGVTWDFDLPASLIENYRNNPGAGGSYTAYFPDNALVGKSSADMVLSFTVEGGLITTILFADEYSLIFE
jgi:hypothetical protein